MRLVPRMVVDGRYEVEALLGEGGVAVVYRVRHTQLGSPHALKVLKLVHPHIRRRLLQEGRLQAHLRHPNIVNVTDVVNVGGSPGLVMEFVEGASLATLLADEKLSLRQADHLARGILEGVAAAHRAGLIHRDLKPANVLLALDHRHQLIPKITDFGLAKVLAPTGMSTTATAPGVTFGTPAYMAPEQIRDATNVDHRADIFSLGVLLYELVSGERCFPGDDVVDVLHRVARADHTPVDAHLPHLPPNIVEAIERALELDPDARWPDVDALLQCWHQDDDPDALWTEETSIRMRTLGRGKELGELPPADGPTDVRTPIPSSALDTLDLSTDERARRRSLRSAPLLLGLGFSTIASIVAGSASALLLLGLGLAYLGLPSPAESSPLPAVAPPTLATTQPPPLTTTPARAPLPAIDPGPRRAPRPAVDPAPSQRRTPPRKPTALPEEKASPRPVRPSDTPITAPPNPAPRTAAVYVGADVTVRLVGPDGSRRAPGGAVPPGRYTVEAIFAGQPHPTGISLHLEPGDIVHIACDPAFQTCWKP